MKSMKISKVLIVIFILLTGFSFAQVKQKNAKPDKSIISEIMKNYEFFKNYDLYKNYNLISQLSKLTNKKTQN